MNDNKGEPLALRGDFGPPSEGTFAAEGKLTPLRGYLNSN